MQEVTYKLQVIKELAKAQKIEIEILKKQL